MSEVISIVVCISFFLFQKDNLTIKKRRNSKVLADSYENIHFQIVDDVIVQK